MIVLGHRECQTSRIAGGRAKTKAAFHDVPSVVSATCAASRLDVHFFAGRLAYIGDVIVSRGLVEGGTPRITQTQCPNFVSRIGISYVRVSRRDCVGRRIAAFDVNSQELTAQNA